MARITRCKDGRLCLEVEGECESLSDKLGTTSFLYMTKKEADELFQVLWAEYLKEQVSAL